MSLLKTTKAIFGIIALTRDAKRLGVAYDDLPAHVFVARSGPKVDPVKWGLVPNADVSVELVSEPGLAEALDAVRSGRWEPAAALVADTFGDWDRRTAVVGALATAAANDDRWLTSWREARPDDAHAWAVHAEALVVMAWQVRGIARADSTTQAQFNGFHRVILEAEAAGRRAVEMAPDDPNPLVTLVTVARALGYSHTRFHVLWETLVALVPDHRAAHVQALQYWCEKWCGSHELMMGFALRAASEFPALRYLPIAAAIEVESERKNVWRDPDVSDAIDSLVERLADEGVDGWALLDDRGYAAYALAATHRHAEAVEQFRRLGTNASRSPWRWFDHPLREFLQTRAEVCRGAGKPKAAH